MKETPEALQDPWGREWKAKEPDREGMKAAFAKRIPLWLLLTVAVTAAAVGLIWSLVAGAPPQNAVLIVPAEGDTGGQRLVANISATTTVSEVATAAPTSIAVYVSGAVARPGVYALQPGARVTDAVAAAGGLLPNADPEAINLAARVSDEEHISVPERAPTPPPGEVASGSTSVVPHSTDAPRKSPTPSKVNINKATASELESLPGIGPSLASRIIEHRTTIGPFKTVEELANVPGIGESTLARLRPLVTVGP